MLAFIKKYALIIFVTFFLLIRLVGIGSDFSNSDALRWHHRTENFLSALKTLHLKDTYQHYQPGVTLMWIASPVRQVIYWISRAHFAGEFSLNNADWFPVIDMISRASLVIILGGLFGVMLFLINKIYGYKTMVIFGFFVVLEPYLVGIDRWFHLTSLESYLSFSSFLLYVAMLRTENKIYLLLSSVLFSFAVLTKTSALILVPIFFVVTILNYKHISLKDLLDFTFVFFITFILFFPALWVAPTYVLTKLVTALVGAGANSIRSESHLIPHVLYYPYILVARLSIISLGLFVWSFVVNLKNKRSYLTYVYLFGFLFILTLAGQKIDRYSISLFLPILLIIAHALARFGWRLNCVVFCSVFIVSGFTFIRYFPQVTSYYSPIIGSTKTAISLGLYENNGEYFADAAKYLNQKGRDIKVLVRYNEASFTPYFKGTHTLHLPADYEVFSLDVDRKDLSLSVCKHLEKTFGPTGNPVVYILSCNVN